MPMEDHSGNCSHNRENHMSFSGISDCDFPDCNCHEFRELIKLRKQSPSKITELSLLVTADELLIKSCSVIS
jgi:hypothetical protein